MITRRDFLKVTAAGGALASLGSVTEAKAAMKSAVPDEGFCHEGARKIPVIAEVDLVVAGGSSRAIAAAVAAAKTVVEFTWLAICPIWVKTYAAHISTSEKQGKNCRQHLHASSFRGKISRLRFI